MSAGRRMTKKNNGPFLSYVLQAVCVYSYTIPILNGRCLDQSLYLLCQPINKLCRDSIDDSVIDHVHALAVVIYHVAILITFWNRIQTSLGLDPVPPLNGFFVQDHGDEYYFSLSMP